MGDGGSESGMTISVQAGEIQDILRWRDLYRAEMNCEIVSESIVFHDRVTTNLAPPAGALFRRVAAADAAGIATAKLDSSADWLVEMDGAIAATGGILFHYNRPYGDIFMQVAEGFRRRGLGSYVV